MRIVCVPILEHEGLLSRISPEFSAAPLFLLVDIATLAFRAVPNTPERQKNRGCNPCGALEDATVDLVIVDGIDPHALGQITRRGVPVHGRARGNVADALASFIGGALPRLAACGGGHRERDGHPSTAPTPAPYSEADQTFEVSGQVPVLQPTK